MGGYHALMHLVNDQLVDACEPRTIRGAIASTGVDTFMPVSGVPFDNHDHGEMPSSSNVPTGHLVMGQQVSGDGNGKHVQMMAAP